MIVKGHTPPETIDRFQWGGGEAERQRAFYLKHSFRDDRRYTCSTTEERAHILN